ncbi:hypothetical protein RB195_001832 [Necator americanus]|uniref:5' exonuclease Apollo n=1 Tax=Necator americanus TaxID=51031 RepID=A0ABR1DHN9_NECAM
MVQLRSKKRTSTLDIPARFGSDRNKDQLQPTFAEKESHVLMLRCKDQTNSGSKSVYDLPSCSSDDSNYVCVERSDLEEKHSQCRKAVLNLKNVKDTPDKSPKSPHLKRSRRESGGPLMLSEALQLAFPSEEAKSAEDQRNIADDDASLEKSLKSDTTMNNGGQVKYIRTDTQLKDTASALTTLNTVSKSSRSLSNVPGNETLDTTVPLTSPRSSMENHNAKNNSKEEPISEKQLCNRTNKLAVSRSSSTPKRPLTPKTARENATPKRQRSLRDLSFLPAVLAASPVSASSGLMPEVKLRNVRFCNDSANEVHIIPAVNTTLPFAEQMAKEQEAETQEQRSHDFRKAVLGEDLEDENIIPKCRKIVIGQRYIAIDRFVRKDGCRYHFLTHAHVDHIVNLNKSWKSPIYCSEMTAKILPIVLGTKAPSSKVLRPLKVGESHVIEPNLLVTVLDSHHCVGSVMFLFEGASIPGGSVLCTGDFRADSGMLARFDDDPSFKKLTEVTSISKIYLDNTYLEYSKPTFPERTESEKMLISEMEKLHDCSILIPVFKLGREDILEKLSHHFSEPITTSSERLAIRKVYGLKQGEFTDGADTSARIRTSPRQAKSVFAALKKMTPPAVVVDISLRGEYTEILKENLITVPYSDHSSCEEIRAFLSRLRFGEIIPTCAHMDAGVAEELMKLSREPRMWTRDQLNWAKRKRSLRLLQE